ncbi:MAG: DUF362 domain-containing protein [Oscillospiraceae bacterium]|nr:DUF362 domain-containing protein [Oscillospiraceae bacterium]
MIIITYAKDISKDTYETLVASDISTYLDASFSVSLKPNLVVPGPASNGAVTHPEVVDGVIRYLKDFGISRIKIIESSWVGDSTLRAFKYCGFEELSKKYNIALIDLKSDNYTTINHSGYDIKVCNEALSTDFLINIPVLKAHCQTRLTCCLKNLKGCIPDSEKRRFHTLGIHKPVAVLNAIIKTGYNVVDGICGDLTFEEGGNPVTSNRIIAGRDPLLVDSYCAELIGYNADDIDYLTYGKKIGVGQFYSKDTKIVELNAENKSAVSIRSANIGERYSSLISEDAACSACYSALTYALHRLAGNVNTREKICIGQGFKGKSGTGIGIGTCTQGFDKCVPGCPPKAIDVLKALRTIPNTHNYNKINETPSFVSDKIGILRKNMREYLYIDDSGDAGLGNTNTNQLVIAAIIVDSDEKRVALTETIDHFRHNLGWNDLAEFKFAKTNKNTLVKLINATDFIDYKIYAIVLNKKVVNMDNVPKGHQPLYGVLINKLLHKIGKTNQVITIDGKFCKKYDKEARVDLRQSLRKNGIVDTKIRFVDSRKNSIVQLADVAAGAIARSYKDKPNAQMYLELFGGKIKSINEIVL